MYIIVNAIKNIGRNKGRNTFMMLMILTIVVTTVVSLVINNTASEIIDEYKQKFGSEVTITPDFEQIRSGGRGAMEGKEITPAQYLEFKDSEYLKDSSVQFSVMANSETITAIDNDKLDELMNGGGQGGLSLRMSGPEGGDGEESEISMPTMKMIGVSSTDDLSEFTSSERVITEGRMFEAVNEVIVSEEFAAENALQIDSEFAIYNISNVEEGQYILRVVGIYEDSTEEYDEQMPIQEPSSNRRNEILTSFETIMSPNYQNGYNGVTGEATYYLNNASDIKTFEAELRAKGLDEIYLVSTDEASVTAIIAPIEGLKNVTGTFMVVVLILGAIILVLLASLSMRERKYEIGVLRAIGMKKSRVMSGLIIEILVMTLVCFGIGLGIGSVASQSVSDKLLAAQIESTTSSTSATDGGPGGFGGPNGGGGRQMIRIGGMSFGNTSNVEPLSELNVTLNSTTVWQIFGLSMLLAFISSSIGLLYIARYEPMKILSNRD